MPEALPMSYQQMRVAVARAVGIADESSSEGYGPPASVHEAQAVDEAVHEAIDEVLAERRWVWATPRASITLAPGGDSAFNVDKDPTLYKLPAWIESLPVGDVNVKDTQSRAFCGRVRVLGDDTVARYNLENPQLIGRPEAVSFASLIEAGGTDRPGWAMRVYPKPDRAYVLSARFDIQTWRFDHPMQHGPWTPPFGRLIVKGAVKCLKRMGLAPKLASEDVDRDYAELLAKLLARDDENRPRHLDLSEESTSQGGYHDVRLEDGRLAHQA